jgi:hypothetical protein
MLNQHYITMSKTIGPATQNRHPIMRLVLENPISALNTAAIIFGGGMVYATMQSQLGHMDRSIAMLENRVARGELAAAAIDQAVANKVEIINRDMTDMKVGIRGIQTSVDFLVQQERRRQN